MVFQQHLLILSFYLISISPNLLGQAYLLPTHKQDTPLTQPPLPDAYASSLSTTSIFTTYFSTADYRLPNEPAAATTFKYHDYVLYRMQRHKSWLEYKLLGITKNLEQVELIAQLYLGDEPYAQLY